MRPGGAGRHGHDRFLVRVSGQPDRSVAPHEHRRFADIPCRGKRGPGHGGECLDVEGARVGRIVAGPCDDPVVAPAVRHGIPRRNGRVGHEPPRDPAVGIHAVEHRRDKDPDVAVPLEDQRQGVRVAATAGQHRRGPPPDAVGSADRQETRPPVENPAVAGDVKGCRQFRRPVGHWHCFTDASPVGPELDQVPLALDAGVRPHDGPGIAVAAADKPDGKRGIGDADIPPCEDAAACRGERRVRGGVIAGQDAGRGGNVDIRRLRVSGVADLGLPERLAIPVAKPADRWPAFTFPVLDNGPRRAGGRHRQPFHAYMHIVRLDGRERGGPPARQQQYAQVAGELSMYRQPSDESQHDAFSLAGGGLIPPTWAVESGQSSENLCIVTLALIRL